MNGQNGNVANAGGPVGCAEVSGQCNTLNRSGERCHQGVIKSLDELANRYADAKRAFEAQCEHVRREMALRDEQAGRVARAHGAFMDALRERGIGAATHVAGEKLMVIDVRY